MKILFAGEGGQGVQAISQILAKAAFTEGKHSLCIPNFGVEQRGGVSLAFLIIDNKPVSYPKFEKADILAILSERSRPRVARYLDKKTKVIYGKQTSLPAKVLNIFVLGKVNQIGKIVSKKNLIQAMDERFAKKFKKEPKLRELDLQALNL